MKKAVHFGAGKIGRGFIAELLHDSGYEVVFGDMVLKKQLLNILAFKKTAVCIMLFLMSIKSLITIYRVWISTLKNNYEI